MTGQDNDDTRDRPWCEKCETERVILYPGAFLPVCREHLDQLWESLREELGLDGS